MLDLDRPQFSICPKCDSKVIRLADGCDICGWSENESRSVESSVSIPCTVKQPNQPERKGVIKQDLRDRFLVEIPSENSTVTVPKLFVYTSIISTDAKVIDTEDKCSSKTIPGSKRRRDQGKGSGWIKCKPIKRKGKSYKQYWYYYEEWRSGARLVQCSEYIPKKMESKIIRMNNEKAPVEKILKVLQNRSKRKK